MYTNTPLLHSRTSFEVTAHANVSADPSTLNTAATARPTSALPSPTSEAALFLPPELLLPVPVEPAALEDGAEGVKTADGFARQEVAAALAPETDEGAFWLIVAFPLKSHDVALRPVAS